MQGLYVSSILLLEMNMLLLVYTLDHSRDLECVLVRREHIILSYSHDNLA